MSTRSWICKKEKDASYKQIYCHHDGYPDHVGKVLFFYYDSQKMVDKLISLGDISSLYKNIAPMKEKDVRRGSEFFGNKLAPHSFDHPHNDVTVAYHRDRGEDLRIGNFDNLESLKKAFSDSWGDYIYIWDGNEWYCNEEKLKDVLQTST